MFFKKIAAILLLYLLWSVAFSQPVSINLQQVSLSDAIYMLAKLNNLNVMVSPSVHGTTSLHLQQVPTDKAFDALLASHGLGKWQEDHIWFIMPRGEWMTHKQDELHWQAVTDETAPLVMRIRQIHYAKANDIAELLQENNNSLLGKRGHVRADVRTNILFIQDTADRVVAIQGLINRLDVPIQQVLIGTYLASVDSHFERDLGIETSSVAADGKYRLAILNLKKGLRLDLQLTALENEGHANLLSSPSLFTANQQTATIESGEEIPYQEVTSSGGTSVAFKKAVLSLKVTPHIMPGGLVLLQLQVNQDKPSNRMVLGVPTIDTRQINTNVLVKSGQTIVLGGIYETYQQEGEQRVPFLGRIPIIGWIFKQQNRADNKRELLIFVTPKVI